VTLPAHFLAQLPPSFFKDKQTSQCVLDRGFCPDWIADNFGRYVQPFFEHVVLTLVTVAIGFVIASALALLAHRLRWLVVPVGAATNLLYTIPSLAAFLLLLPVTGRGNLTALVVLVAYSLTFMFANTVNGLRGVPADITNAARGQGMTDRQVLWRVEIPLALPEIMAGLRIASTTTVGLVALAFYAGAGGLGAQILTDLYFKSNVVVAGGLAVLLAAALDVAILLAQRALIPWKRVGA
jgi:osmoprotectant transport system permease protein